MSKTTNFWSDLQSDPNMEKELNDFLKTSEAKSEEAKIERITEFARKKGYETDEEDIAMAKAEFKAAQLPESELAKVVGGASKEEMQEYCFADYLCELAWNHCVVSNECNNSAWRCSSAVSYGNCIKALTARTGCSGVFLPGIRN